jgi:hypothetical protein
MRSNATNSAFHRSGNGCDIRSTCWSSTRTPPSDRSTPYSTRTTRFNDRIEPRVRASEQSGYTPRVSIRRSSGSLGCLLALVALASIANIACGGGARERPSRRGRQSYVQSQMQPQPVAPAPRPSLFQRFTDMTGLSSHLPRQPDGRISLLQIAGSRLEINPSLHDPLTALGACADLVTGCYGPTAPLDSCMASARVCTTAQPWNESSCCPAACSARYVRERQSGRAPVDAFETVMFRQPDCFPGVSAMLVRTP